MKRVIEATALGNYQPIGDVSTADSVIAQTFGIATSRTITDVNRLLGEFSSQYELPVIAQSQVAPHVRPDLLAATIGTGTAEEGYLDTYDVLTLTAKKLAELSLSKSVLVAQAHHAYRVHKQAGSIGLKTILPPGLPKAWDRHSSQPWTRNAGLWTAHEVIGYPYLKARGRI